MPQMMIINDYATPDIIRVPESTLAVSSGVIYLACKQSTASLHQMQFPRAAVDFLVHVNA